MRLPCRDSSREIGFGLAGREHLLSTRRVSSRLRKNFMRTSKYCRAASTEARWLRRRGAFAQPSGVPHYDLAGKVWLPEAGSGAFLFEPSKPLRSKPRASRRKPLSLFLRARACLAGDSGGAVRDQACLSPPTAHSNPRGVGGSFASYGRANAKWRGAEILSKAGEMGASRASGGNWEIIFSD